MNFTEALGHLINPDKIVYATRKNWAYKLYFCPWTQYLTIRKDNETIPYVISCFDFKYMWEITEL